MKDEPKKVEDLDAEWMSFIGKIIKKLIPPGAGFSVVVFDFGYTLREFRYISNAHREDMIQTFRQMVAKWEMEAGEN